MLASLSSDTSVLGGRPSRVPWISQRSVLQATFLGPHEIQVGDRRLRFRKAVVATGGRAKVPPIPGLEYRGEDRGVPWGGEWLVDLC